MSLYEIGSILLGLAAGFWIVSRIMEGRANPLRPDDPPPASDAEPEPQSERASESAWKQTDTSWWTVLEVPRTATREEVVRAYKRKISEYHPDKVARMGEEIRALAERKSQDINAAYDVAMRRF
jgi:DnaJ like chaperone protein